MDLLNKISNKTRDLWYEVNKKYGDHTYSLNVTGTGKICLCKGYTTALVKGTNAQVQQKLKELLK